jgi:primary-amine oxidase
MADRLKQLYQHLTESTAPPHPFDPLSSAEIEYAIALVRKEYGQLGYNAVTLSESKKKEMLAWLANPSLPRPRRMAEVVAVDRDSAVYDGVVDLKDGKIMAWEKLSGVQPLVRYQNLSLDGWLT